jgi:hypothetical protein
MVLINASDTWRTSPWAGSEFINKVAKLLAGLAASRKSYKFFASHVSVLN